MSDLFDLRRSVINDDDIEQPLTRLSTLTKRLTNYSGIHATVFETLKKSAATCDQNSQNIKIG